MPPSASPGFTMIELILVMIVTGIMAAYVAPKLMDNSDFQARGFADQVKATLRYAQKTAVAQRRFVCVAYTPSSIALTISATVSCPGAALAAPDGKSTYDVAAPAGITFSPTPASFSFDALGRPTPNAQQTASISGGATIIVEAETGYVH